MNPPRQFDVSTLCFKNGVINTTDLLFSTPYHSPPSLSSSLAISGIAKSYFSSQGIRNHYMDKAEPNKELSEDSTRESLIALSYGVPDNARPAATSPKHTSCEAPASNVEEESRSELISISYSSSPDMEAQLPSP